MNLVGQYATKRRGFFSGLIGRIEINGTGSPSTYLLRFKGGQGVGFNRLDEVELIDTTCMQQTTRKHDMYATN